MVFKSALQGILLQWIPLGTWNNMMRKFTPGKAIYVLQFGSLDTWKPSEAAMNPQKERFPPHMDTVKQVKVTMYFRKSQGAMLRFESVH